MQYPFKNLPHIKRPQVTGKNFAVLKLNADGGVIKTFMAGLTRVEAEGVAKAGNRYNQSKGVKCWFRVTEEK